MSSICNPSKLLLLLVLCCTPLHAQKIDVLGSDGVKRPVSPSGGATISNTGVITLGSISLSSGVSGTLPVANGGTGITSFGTGVATALGVNVGSAGAFTVYGGVGNFAALTATGNVNFISNGQNITISPTGVGVLTINPTLSGLMDNVRIGLTTPAQGEFTTLNASEFTIASVAVPTISSTSTLTNKTLTAPVLTAPVLGDGSGATAILASNLSGATDPTITFGNAAVTLASGVLSLPNGAVGAPSVNFGDATTGIYRGQANEVTVATGGVRRFAFNSTTLYFPTDAGLIALGVSSDATLTRVAAKVLGFGDSVTTADRDGWMQWAGQARVSTQFDKTNDAALANVTGLTVALQNGRTYKFQAHLNATLDATGGGQYAMAFSAAVTSISYRVRHLGASLAVVSSTRQTASGGAVNATATLTDDDVVIEGVIIAGAAGNLTVQFAQQTATPATTSSVLVGSTMLVWDMP